MDLIRCKKGLERLINDLGEVSEYVVTAVVRSDEAEALGVIEPFNGTGCHVLFPYGIALSMRKAHVNQGK